MDESRFGKGRLSEGDNNVLLLVGALLEFVELDRARPADDDRLGEGCEGVRGVAVRVRGFNPGTDAAFGCRGGVENAGLEAIKDGSSRSKVSGSIVVKRYSSVMNG